MHKAPWLLGASDLLANWQSARTDYTKVGTDVPPEDPTEAAAYVKQYREQSCARIADAAFAMKNNIAPPRFSG